MEFTKEAFDKLIEQVEAMPKPQEFIFYAFSKEVGELFKEYFPDVKVVVLPQSYMLNEDDKDKVFIIPVDNCKPVKVCFDNGDVDFKLDGTVGCWNFER